MANRFGVLTIIFGMLVVLCSLAVHAENVSQLKPAYKNWLDEDVRWIMTARERDDFLALTSDQARDKFVVEFWERRNPTPGTKENAFKEEHYRRLAFANDHFAADLPGWKTDRGRIYIVYGPPDSIDARRIVDHAQALERNSDRPYQVWHYNHIKGIGDNQNIKFVDVCSCGDYKMVIKE